MSANTWLFASGKGGVGKSTIAASLAVALAHSGKRIVLIDADIGLRSQDLLLNLESRVVYDLMDVARGRCLLSQALLESPDFPGLFLLPAAQFARCRELEAKKLKRMISLLQKKFDLILIDCPAGVERGLRNVLNAGASQTVLVVTPDDLSIRSAERVAALIEEKKLPQPQIIVNRLKPELIRFGDMYAARVISEVLDLPLLGEIPEDQAICVAQLRHRPVLAYACEAREAILRIADRMKDGNAPLPGYGLQKESFLHRLLGMRRGRQSPSRLREVDL